MEGSNDEEYYWQKNRIQKCGRTYFDFLIFEAGGVHNSCVGGGLQTDEPSLNKGS
jgi:hypothetical protein